MQDMVKGFKVVKSLQNKFTPLTLGVLLSYLNILEYYSAIRNKLSQPQQPENPQIVDFYARPAFRVLVLAIKGFTAYYIAFNSSFSVRAQRQPSWTAH